MVVVVVVAVVLQVLAEIRTGADSTTRTKRACGLGDLCVKSHMGVDTYRTTGYAERAEVAKDDNRSYVPSPEDPC